MLALATKGLRTKELKQSEPQTKKLKRGGAADKGIQYKGSWIITQKEVVQVTNHGFELSFCRRSSVAAD